MCLLLPRVKQTLRTTWLTLIALAVSSPGVTARTIAGIAADTTPTPNPSTVTATNGPATTERPAANTRNPQATRSMLADSVGAARYLAPRPALSEDCSHWQPQWCSRPLLSSVRARSHSLTSSCWFRVAAVTGTDDSGPSALGEACRPAT